MGALTKEQFAAYKEKLEKALMEYMSMPANERSSNAVRGMQECYLLTEDAEDHVCKCARKHSGEMTEADMKAWAAKMENCDGSRGPHWTLEQTTNMAENMGMTWEKVSRVCWWVTMNMMYSDYCEVAAKYGVAISEFYADMARAFLMDRDGPGPKEKLAGYYHGIVQG